MSMQFDLSGRRILVVGASSGVGLETGRLASQAGGRVAFAARREELVRDAAASAQGGAIGVRCDVCDADACRSAVETTLAEFGGLDAVIYATGMSPLVMLENASQEEWRRVLDTNLIGASLITAAAGANAFLPQPVESRRFLETVNALLRNEEPTHRPRVLIVEDDPHVSKLLRITFEKYGYEAEVASNGRDASEKIGETSWQNAVVDYHLPDMKGDKLIQDIRHQCPACAVVMITGDTDPQMAVSWLKAGAAAYVLKPFDPVYLVELCARASRERSLLRSEELLEERSRDLRESEAFNAALFDYSPTETMVVDSDGCIVKWNRARSESVGHLPVVGDRMYVDYAGHHETDMRAELMQCIETGETKEFPELEYGDEVLYIKIAPFPDENPHAAIITSQDITSRKRTEEMLRREGEFRGAVIEGVDEGICVLGEERSNLTESLMVLGREPHEVEA